MRGADRDDVWSLLQRLLAVVSVAVVLLGGRQIPLELLALGVALWLPSAGSRRLWSSDAAALVEGRRAQAGRPSGR